jgi:hypothetical protein
MSNNTLSLIPSSRWLSLSTALLLLALAGCSTQSVKSTTVTPVVSDNATIPEDELLDVAVAIFDPGLDDIPNKRKELTFADVRIAETQFVSYHLAQTLQSSGAWGVVRVNPNDTSTADLAVSGTIIQSDGEAMVLKVTARDVSGKVWIEKEYEEVVSKFSYDPRLRRPDDPFQGLYNRIANDLLAYRKQHLNREALLAIRTLSRIQFARSFAPQAFDQYVTADRKGALQLTRLPANDDPMLSRIDTIRERDYLYVDALQDYYGNYVRQMTDPYNSFRRQSYEQVIKFDRTRTAARRNMVMGVAAIVGGLVGVTQSNSSAVQYSSWGGLFGGGYLIKDAFAKRDEAQMQAEVLAELGDSLESEVAPHTIELDERVITLTGSVQEQYAQWREILADIYAAELQGSAPAVGPTSTTPTPPVTN